MKQRERFSQWFLLRVWWVVSVCWCAGVASLKFCFVVSVFFQDAIDTAAESGDTSLAEDLLSFFVNIGDKECFCAALYTCYSLIRPDVAMELAWRNKCVFVLYLFLLRRRAPVFLWCVCVFSFFYFWRGVSCSSDLCWCGECCGISKCLIM